jgi:hypothetical protein
MQFKLIVKTKPKDLILKNSSIYYLDEDFKLTIYDINLNKIIAKSKNQIYKVGLIKDKIITTNDYQNLKVIDSPSKSFYYRFNEDFITKDQVICDQDD